MALFRKSWTKEIEVTEFHEAEDPIGTWHHRRSTTKYMDQIAPKIDPAAVNRVTEAHKTAGLLASSVDYKPLLDLSIVEN